MPKDNIERAIARGSGADTDAQAFETVIYEGMGRAASRSSWSAHGQPPGRTAADVRHTLRERRRETWGRPEPSPGSSSGAGSCSSTCGADEDDSRSPRPRVERTTSRSTVPVPGGRRARSLTSVREAIEASRDRVPVSEASSGSGDHDRAGGRGRGQEGVAPDRTALEDSDDVQDVYANFDIPERVLDAVAS